MKKAIIFDFDGLIIDTEVAWHEAYASWLKDTHDYPLDFELFLTCIGTTNHHFVKKVSQDLGIEIDHAEFNREINALAAEKSKQLPLRPGIQDLLDFAKEKGIPCVIGTSSNRAHLEEHLDRLKIRSYFKGFVTADDVTMIKPSPAIYNKASELLGVSKDAILIFEDSLNGLLAGNRAGIDVVVVANDVTKHIQFPETYVEKVTSVDQFDYHNLFQ